MSKPELFPCGCGDKYPSEVAQHNDGDVRFRVQCREDEGGCGADTGRYDTPEEARGAWAVMSINRRATSAEA